VGEHEGYHEPIEELEAIDWCDQRVNATTDDTLRAILAQVAVRISGS